ncbi:MAG: lipoyl(octanoyl) transferase LipB [Thermodesulfobacteriota bacterium]
MISCRLMNLDYLDYRHSLALMRRLAAVRAESGPEVLILAEHPPVITLGRRATEAEITAPVSALDRAGVTVHRVERGGLATYHGPGQLVAYPIFNLHFLRIGLMDLVQALEEIILTVLKEFGLEGRRVPDARGVWVGRDKIASIGLAVRRGITFHGLALNNDPDLSHFDFITPCGLEGIKLTSIRKLLGRPADPELLRDLLAGRFARTFDLDFQPFTLAEAEDLIGREVLNHAQAAVA